MQRAVAWLLLLVGMCACRSNESKAEPSAIFSAHRPERIRALAPIDRVGTAAGVALVRKRVAKQLERRGYVADRAGRTATLHVVIERWGRVADGSGRGSAGCVELSARLYDDATGALIWEGGGKSGCDSDDEFEEDDWLGRVVSGLVDWVVDSLTDDLESAGESAVDATLRSLPRRAAPSVTSPTPTMSDASAGLF